MVAMPQRHWATSDRRLTLALCAGYAQAHSNRLAIVVAN
jgi:hypothetical protein